MLKIRESKQRIDFSKESRQKRSSGHAGCGSQLYQKSFNQIEKKEYSSISCFLSECSHRHRGSRCDNSTQCLLLRAKIGENQKTVSFNLLSPQNVPLEMMNATLTMLPISCEVAIKFQIMCGNDKYFNFSHKVQLLTVFHWTRKSTLKIVPQGFRSNSKRSHLYEKFQRVVFSKKFLWTRKRRFWQAPGTCFCQNLH